MGKLGVGINLAKSVVSFNKTTEFAKVTTHNGLNVSAISWKMFISQNTMMGRVNIAFSLLGKGIIHSGYMR
jgi:predicted DNA-binding transcriptional regulator